jgi:hypothetical protein
MIIYLLCVRVVHILLVQVYIQVLYNFNAYSRGTTVNTHHVIIYATINTQLVYFSQQLVQTVARLYDLNS